MTSQQSTDRSNPEAGFAMVYALMVILVVGGIVGVVFSFSLSEVNQASFELDFEDTVHVAEAGAEVYLQRLAADPDENSGIVGPTTAGQDPADWAIDVATERDAAGNYVLDASEPRIDMGEGEVVAIRPVGTDANFIYGVGFTPSRASYVAGNPDAFARVVRVQVAFSPSVFAGDHALLTGGNLTLSGTFDFKGATGKVHTNGGIAINGSGTVAKGVTHSGSCTKGCTGANAPTRTKNEPIPTVDPIDVWGTKSAREIAAQGQWFEYCGGQWYVRTAAAKTPCDAINSTLRTTPPPGWTGTSLTSTVDSNAVYFFKDKVNVSLKRLQGKVTVITGGNIDVGPSSNLPPFDARYPGLLFLAGGDISIGGNATGFGPATAAVVYANGALTLGGTMQMNQISFTARDGTNVGTSYKGGGGGGITYDGGAITDLGAPGEPIVVQWDEVR